MATKRRNDQPTGVTRRRRPTGPMIRFAITVPASIGKRVLRARSEGPEIRTASDVFADCVAELLDTDGRRKRPGAPDGPVEAGGGE